MRNHRITKPDFRPCSTCRSRSQAPLCLCTLRMISNHSEGNLWAPPLHFRRRPPQSNCPPDTVSRVDKTRRLEFQYSQGGIPPVPPPKLAPGFNGSPPSCTNCTKIQYQATVKLHGVFPSCRVTCIFTGTIISPSLWLRQCPNRYTFRAVGTYPTRNFCHLGNVIWPPFTGASVQSFAYANPLLNLPAPGRCHPILRLTASQSCVLLNSRLGLFTAAFR